MRRVVLRTRDGRVWHIARHRFLARLSRHVSVQPKKIKNTLRRHSKSQKRRNSEIGEDPTTDTRSGGASMPGIFAVRSAEVLRRAQSSVPGISTSRQRPAPPGLYNRKRSGARRAVWWHDQGANHRGIFKTRIQSKRKDNGRVRLRRAAKPEAHRLRRSQGCRI